MTLFGFLSRQEIKIHQLVGDGCMVFMPSEGDGNSQRAWSALIQAMLELDMVAIVRKVYNKSSAPRLGALIPEYNEDGDIMLIFVELPFAEDLKQMEFPSLPKPNEEQVEAMDDLVDQMMLSEVDDEGNELNNCFEPSEMLNPNIQYQYQCIRHRALHPGMILPSPDEHILNILRVPEEIESAAEPAFERIRELFKTKVIESSANKKRKLTDNDNNEDDDNKKAKTDNNKATEVGTASPLEDFHYLLSHSITNNTSFELIAHQLELVIMKLLSSNYGGNIFRKIEECLRALREECCSRGKPKIYNDFIKKVKASLDPSSKMWLDIIEANLGLIANSEVAGGVNDQEAADFMMPPEDSDEKLKDSVMICC